MLNKRQAKCPYIFHNKVLMKRLGMIFMMTFCFIVITFVTCQYGPGQLQNLCINMNFVASLQ